jgi:HEAT repeat protein
MSSEATRREAEEHRHERALALSAASATAASVVELLGDASWRVRKAVLARIPAVAGVRDLVPALASALGDPDNAGLRSACAEALVALGAAAVPELVKALSTPDVDRRKFVVEVLGASRTTAAREALVSALDDGDENVRAAVVGALGALGDGEVIRALRERLSRRGGEPQLTAYVLDALDRLGAALRYEELEPFLGRPELARLTYPLLGRCAEPAATARLVDAVAGGTRGARADAVRALGEQCRHLDAGGRSALRQRLAASPQAVSTIDMALDGSDDRVGEAAVVLLGLLGEPARAPRILAAAAARPFVRAAIEAVRPLGAATQGPLLAALDVASTEARVLFLEIIESVGDATAVPKLLLIGRSPETRAAEAAVSAVGKLAGIEHLDALMAIARDGEPEVVRQTAIALAALGMRTPDPVAGALRAAIANGDVRPMWVVVLGLLGRDVDIDTVVAASRHRDPEVRRAAVEAFATWGQRIDEAVVVLALADENPEVRAAAARALGAYRSERAVDVLLAATADPDHLVVSEALKALGAVGGERASATLLTAASSSSAPVAIAALQSLFRARPAGVAAAVERALGHADPEVVREAIVLTMRLEPERALPLLVTCLSHRSWHVRLAAAEMVGNRDLPVPERELSTRLDEETEPLVRDALGRLATSGRTRGA